MNYSGVMHYYYYYDVLNELTWPYRDLQALLVLRDLLVNQALRDSMVLMEKQVLGVNQEKKDLKVLLEGVSTDQNTLVGLDKKEMKDHKESLVLLAEMALLDQLDLKENAADMQNLARKAYPVNQENLVKMVNQETQEHLVVKDKKAKLLDWKNSKIKLKMASNLFAYN